MPYKLPAIAGLLIVALVAFSACDGEEEVMSSPTPSPTPSPPGEITFEAVASGTHSGIELDSPELFRIDDQGQWVDFWDRHTSIVLDPGEPPSVDFDLYTVIAVVDRLRPSGGFSLAITRVDTDGTVLQVHAHRTEPGAGCVVTEALTQPFDIVRIDASDLEPELVLTTDVIDCE
jgi:hypothetical protein